MVGKYGAPQTKFLRLYKYNAWSYNFFSLRFSLISHRFRHQARGNFFRQTMLAANRLSWPAGRPAWPHTSVRAAAANRTESGARRREGKQGRNRQLCQNPNEPQTLFSFRRWRTAPTDSRPLPTGKPSPADSKLPAVFLFGKEMKMDAALGNLHNNFVILI